MNATTLLLVIAGYFAFLLLVSYLTTRNSDSTSFYLGNKTSPWYLVAFSMIGASLSGVTFLSVPGEVGADSFHYFQIVLGYLAGYLVIGTVLMPLYYRLQLTSIYTYLEQRFGAASYKTGASFFLMSRTIGATFRLFLVAGVMQFIIFNELGVPFWATVAITIGLIYAYTFKGGIKTIVWTDSLQTFFMLLAVVLAIVHISSNLGISFTDIIPTIQQSNYSEIFVLDDISKGNHFIKHFLFGMFVAIAMTGLDQDMMQKNLSCKSIGDAQKNMFWFSIVLVIVNLVFLALGALLYMYATKEGIEIPARKDYLFGLIAKNHLGGFTAAIFFIGLIAAAYSSADSALTALTTSFCIDILGINPTDDSTTTKRKRTIVHISFALLLFLLIIWANRGNNDAVINKVFNWASYTYGPLLGLYAFGLFSKRKAKDIFVPFICILAPIATYFLFQYFKSKGFQIGLLSLPINGIITLIGLFVISSKEDLIRI